MVSEMPMRIVPLTLLALGSAAIAARGQALLAGQSGRRALLPREREIALARSAAPPAVSDSATIYVLGASGWEIAVHGSNGVACHVNRSWVESLEPHCYDPEGAVTILPMELRRTELLHQGRSLAETNRDVADGLATGRFRLPRRPALSYMLSAAQRLIGDDGRPVGVWRPHLMIFFPFLTAAELGLGANQDTRAALLVDPGTPTANLMIIVREFVQPGSPGAPPQ
jgi:hypothetical protein